MEKEEVKKSIYASLLIFLLVSSFIYGIGVGKREWFPHNLIKEVKYLVLNHSGDQSGDQNGDQSGEESGVKFDSLYRLIESSSHTKIACPKQTSNIGVLVAFGQSNSANHAEYKFSKAELDGVINYFDGRCFSAESPLLGATADGGEWMSLTAKKLIDEGLYEKVIIVSSGIGGTPIVRWADGNDLNTMFTEVLQNLLKDYNVTDMIWHQGENDRKYTHTDVYKTYFLSLLASIRAVGINAPIFISIASICGEEGTWVYPNRVTAAQESLLDYEGIEFGVNTDEVVPIELRYDKCHFGKDGQELAASVLADSIVKFHSVK